MVAKKRESPEFKLDSQSNEQIRLTTKQLDLELEPEPSSEKKIASMNNEEKEKSVAGPQKKSLTFPTISPKNKIKTRSTD